MTKYRKTDTPPSDMFLDSMSEGGVGSDKLTCEWCNRVHLCPDNEYAERDGQDRAAYRAYCEEEHKNNPDGVVLHHDCDGVTGRFMNNILFVLDCPCNGLYRYEAFIWEHKDTIRNYLAARILQEKQWDEEELVVNRLAGVK